MNLYQKYYRVDRGSHENKLYVKYLLKLKNLAIYDRGKL